MADETTTTAAAPDVEQDPRMVHLSPAERAFCPEIVRNDSKPVPFWADLTQTRTTPDNPNPVPKTYLGINWTEVRKRCAEDPTYFTTGLCQFLGLDMIQGLCQAKYKQQMLVLWEKNSLKDGSVDTDQLIADIIKGALVPITKAELEDALDELSLVRIQLAHKMDAEYKAAVAAGQGLAVMKESMAEMTKLNDKEDYLREQIKLKSKKRGGAEES